MSINGALKNLITKLGGTATKKTTEGLINEIADNVSDGGGSGGGGEGGEGGNNDIIVINVDYAQNAPEEATCDKTFEEILNYVNNNYALFYKINYTENSGKIEKLHGFAYTYGTPSDHITQSFVYTTIGEGDGEFWVNNTAVWVYLSDTNTVEVSLAYL